LRPRFGLDPSETMQPSFEIVIGLEVHAELATQSKIFCGCSTRFGAPANTQVCPVCLGLPGSLPVLNARALELGLRAALALDGAPAEHTKFDRKNYFYPDLPKAYQISQYDLPVARGGAVWIDTPEGAKRIGITRVHLEEDAGKLLHSSRDGQIGAAAGSRVDYNRAGVPLIEIVSEPDLRSADEAYAYLLALKEILRYAEVSDCNMEEGSLRCDANISVRPAGQAALGTKVEIKNMNSFKHVRAALEYEARRQVRVLGQGGSLVQETRLWDADRGATQAMRGKEEAHDYRYFPEPDLPLLEVGADRVAEIRSALPELPRARRERLIQAYGLSAYDAGVITAEKERADFFEDAVKARPQASPKTISNLLTGDLLGKLNADQKYLSQSSVTPVQLAAASTLVDSGQISATVAKQVFAETYATGKDPEQIVQEQGLTQISDAASLEKLVDEVLAAHPGPVAEFRGGKTQALGFLVGQVMKASAGRANPKRVNELLRARLG